MLRPRAAGPPIHSLAAQAVVHDPLEGCGPSHPFTCCPGGSWCSAQGQRALSTIHLLPRR
eukprot:10568965-Alexandrium_andersonii.AAC.1